MLVYRVTVVRDLCCCMRATPRFVPNARIFIKLYKGTTLRAREKQALQDLEVLMSLQRAPCRILPVHNAVNNNEAMSDRSSPRADRVAVETTFIVRVSCSQGIRTIRVIPCSWVNHRTYSRNQPPRHHFDETTIADDWRNA